MKQDLKRAAEAVETLLAISVAAARLARSISIGLKKRKFEKGGNRYENARTGKHRK